MGCGILKEVICPCEQLPELSQAETAQTSACEMASLLTPASRTNKTLWTPNLKNSFQMGTWGQWLLGCKERQKQYPIVGWELCERYHRQITIMRRQRGPNHKLSGSQRASVFGNTFMFCHRPELWGDSLVLTCFLFSGQYVAMKGLRKKKKGRCCPSEFVPSYLFLSYTLAMRGFLQKERRSLTWEKPADDTHARTRSSGCWDGRSGFYLSPPEHGI